MRVGSLHPLCEVVPEMLELRKWGHGLKQGVLGREGPLVRVGSTLVAGNKS